MMLQLLPDFILKSVSSLKNFDLCTSTKKISFRLRGLRKKIMLFHKQIFSYQYKIFWFLHAATIYPILVAWSLISYEINEGIYYSFRGTLFNSGNYLDVELKITSLLSKQLFYYASYTTLMGVEKNSVHRVFYHLVCWFKLEIRIAKVHISILIDSRYEIWEFHTCYSIVFLLLYFRKFISSNPFSPMSENLFEFKVLCRLYMRSCKNHQNYHTLSKFMSDKIRYLNHFSKEKFVICGVDAVPLDNWHENLPL